MENYYNTANSAVPGAHSFTAPPPPPPPYPIPSDAESIDRIAAAEAKVAGIMADFLEYIFRKITTVCDPVKQVDLTQIVLTSYACKENAMAEVIRALASKILADRSCCSNDSSCCK